MEKEIALKQFLADNNIPSMVYYPIPLYKQEAFKTYYDGEELPVTEKLCLSVLSLPIHTEMDDETLNYIINTVKKYFS